MAETKKKIVFKKASKKDEEEFAKAQAESKIRPLPNPTETLSNQEILRIMEAQFKVLADGLDEIKILLKTIYENQPKKLNTSFLDK